MGGDLLGAIDLRLSFGDVQNLPIREVAIGSAILVALALLLLWPRCIRPLKLPAVVAWETTCDAALGVPPGRLDDLGCPRPVQGVLCWWQGRRSSSP